MRKKEVKVSRLLRAAQMTTNSQTNFSTQSNKLAMTSKLKNNKNTEKHQKASSKQNNWS